MTIPRIALLVAVVLAGLSAGFFYTYEASVTPGLARVDDTTYVATFQAINEAIRNPAFGIIFFGPVPAIATALLVHWNHGHARRWLIGAALVLYLALIAITGTGNVPLNHQLAEHATVTPATAAEARVDFEGDWNRLNLIRTISVAASFLLLTVAAGLPAQQGCGQIFE